MSSPVLFLLFCAVSPHLSCLPCPAPSLLYCPVLSFLVLYSRLLCLSSSLLSSPLSLLSSSVSPALSSHVLSLPAVKVRVWCMCTPPPSLPSCPSADGSPQPAQGFFLFKGSLSLSLLLIWGLCSGSGDNPDLVWTESSAPCFISSCPDWCPTHPPTFTHFFKSCCASIWLLVDERIHS